MLSMLSRYKANIRPSRWDSFGREGSSTILRVQNWLAMKRLLRPSCKSEKVQSRRTL